MPYDEKFKDEDFLDAFGNGWLDTQAVANKVMCSYEEAKFRLRILSKENKVIPRKQSSGGSEHFKWEWKRNKKYVEPVMNPDGLGLHFFDRGIAFERIRFMKFSKACKSIAEASGTVFVEDVESKFLDDKIYIGSSTSDKSLTITRIIDSTLKAMKSDDKGRYYEFAYTGDEPYNIAVVACLIALKQFFPKVKLSLGVDNKGFDDAIGLIKSIDPKNTGIKKINLKKLLHNIRDIDRKELVMRAI